MFSFQYYATTLYRGSIQWTVSPLSNYYIGGSTVIHQTITQVTAVVHQTIIGGSTEPPSNYYVGGSTEPPSNYYIGNSTCIMTYVECYATIIPLHSCSILFYLQYTTGHTLYRRQSNYKFLFTFILFLPPSSVHNVQQI